MGWARGNQTPRIWLDKACIDQSNISASLACLPIYLSGCRKLLIVAGPTYSSRLWCLMEIFTFVRFNGDSRDIALHAFDEAVSTSLATDFDAASAQCYKPSDRHRLLAVIEAAFGDCHGFNLVVRDIFAAKTGLQEDELATCSASSRASGRTACTSDST